MNTYEQHSKRKLIATALAIIVIAGSVVFADHLKAESAESATTLTQTSTSTPATTSTSSTPTTATDTSTTATTTASSYKDGTYDVTASYYVPHGTENIKVSLTLSSGTVTDVSIQNSESDRESAAYQQDFASVYKSYVVGKKISSLQLSTIAGASDTTQGFNDAISQIANKAQA